MAANGNNGGPNNGAGTTARGLLGRQTDGAESLFPAGGKKWRRLLEMLLGLAAVVGAAAFLIFSGGKDTPALFSMPVFAVSSAANGVGLFVGGSRGVLYPDDGPSSGRLALSGYLLIQAGCLGMMASLALGLLGWP